MARSQMKIFVRDHALLSLSLSYPSKVAEEAVSGEKESTARDRKFVVIKYNRGSRARPNKSF